SPLPDPEQSPIRQVLYPESTRRSLPFGVQGSDIVDCQRRDVSIGMAPNYGGFYPIEPNSMYTSSPMRWKVEEPSATTPNPFASLDRSSGSTAAFPVFSDVSCVNYPYNMAVIGATQPPVGLSTSEAMENSAAIHQGQTRFRDTIAGPSLNSLMKYDWSQLTYEGLIKGEDDYPSSALCDRSRVSTLEPSSRAAETQKSTHVVKSGKRYICGICLKSHARPSRAIACQNEHLGYKPFVCDGTCGDSVW
ncbi:hypothetical protein FRC16_010330, partial [Serendipita sp. 398]